MGAFRACGQQSHDVLFCTQPAGHTGPHVAQDLTGNIQLIWVDQAEQWRPVLDNFISRWTQKVDTGAR